MSCLKFNHVNNHEKIFLQKVNDGNFIYQKLFLVPNHNPGIWPKTETTSTFNYYRSQPDSTSGLTYITPLRTIKTY